jgi:hypothetical protein
MNLNTHYVVLFKNPRDAGQGAILAQQMYPGKSNFVVEAFRDATREPYDYLLIDLKSEMKNGIEFARTYFPTTRDSTSTFRKYKRP